MTFEDFKHKLEIDNAIPLMDDNQEWVMRDTWDYQQMIIDQLKDQLELQKSLNRAMQLTIGLRDE